MTAPRREAGGAGHPKGRSGAKEPPSGLTRCRHRGTRLPAGPHRTLIASIPHHPDPDYAPAAANADARLAAVALSSPAIREVLGHPTGTRADGRPEVEEDWRSVNGEGQGERSPGPDRSATLVSNPDEQETIMSFGLNRAEVIGRLGADVTINNLASGGRVANLSIATDESYIDKNGERVDRTEWHR